LDKQDHNSAGATRTPSGESAASPVTGFALLSLLLSFFSPELLASSLRFFSSLADIASSSPRPALFPNTDTFERIGGEARPGDSSLRVVRSNAQLYLVPRFSSNNYDQSRSGTTKDLFALLPSPQDYIRDFRVSIFLPFLASCIPCFAKTATSSHPYIIFVYIAVAIKSETSLV